MRHQRERENEERIEALQKMVDEYKSASSATPETDVAGSQTLRSVMLRQLGIIKMVAVSDALGTITSAGQSVQVRINSREASVDQVKNLLPATIKRVEWIENPGLRYNGANTVLNFVVVNPTLGGSLLVIGTQTKAIPAQISECPILV